VGQIFFVDIRKTYFSEKSRLIGQGKNPGDTVFHRFSQAGLDQLPADAMALGLISHRQRADFSQVFPTDMQGANPGDCATVTGVNDKIAQMIIEGTYRSAQQEFLVGIPLQNTVNLPHILHPGLSD
jgi:hypothetical protein